MTDAEIQKDREVRKEQCVKEVQAVCDKYEMMIDASELLTPNFRVEVRINFIDLKKYDTPIAQPDQPIVSPYSPEPTTLN